MRPTSAKRANPPVHLERPSAQIRLQPVALPRKRVASSLQEMTLPPEPSHRVRLSHIGGARVNPWPQSVSHSTLFPTGRLPKFGRGRDRRTAVRPIPLGRATCPDSAGGTTVKPTCVVDCVDECTSITNDFSSIPALIGLAREAAGSMIVRPRAITLGDYCITARSAPRAVRARPTSTKRKTTSRPCTACAEECCHDESAGSLIGLLSCSTKSTDGETKIAVDADRLKARFERSK